MLKRSGVILLITAVLLLLAAGCSQAGSHSGQANSSKGQEASGYSNPLIEQRADPWVYKHTDGYYYFTGSVPAYDRIELRRAKTIEELAEAEASAVWEKKADGPMSKHIWAPEIHSIDGKWYVYYAAAREDAPFDHRIYVLENASANPLEGQWTEKGQLKTDWESFSLDATTFEHRGVRYLVWAQKDPAIRGNSNLYIAEMSNPWTLASEQVMISKPELPWETIGFWVNEGAAVLHRNGKLFMTYSGSATDENYAVGLLTADEDADLLDAASWSKTQEPVFRSSTENGQFGPGHNSFTVSEDGKRDLLVYHSRSYREIEGDPLYDPNRHTRVQPFGWKEDGTPDFGVPAPESQ
ncbi:glycoside hydrolase family 43 protein [Paenibacillus soyae]|uniref:Family 43 glycosylhydrolase n=1 Tax=Paenibacillus soyae TaxID=2969249 RepID=A0A9X2SC33_9BACL|nr:family 43 glycosylhydrolase [Paenibacillus soyae]MCR2807831.1 family 43 glycosylhydrolase [Paenibacillus soyae]